MASFVRRYLQLVGEAENDEFGGTHDRHSNFDDEASFQNIRRRHGVAEAAVHVEAFLRLGTYS
jgi:hypothetical protein